jgi:hypothetical protein
MIKKVNSQYLTPASTLSFDEICEFVEWYRGFYGDNK